MQQVTYFMFDDQGDRVKIGRTADIERRLVQLRTGNAGLRLLGWLEGDRELVLHDLFAADRLGGEWFGTASGRVCRWLDRMRALGRLQGPYATR